MDFRIDTPVDTDDLARVAAWVDYLDDNGAAPTHPTNQVETYLTASALTDPVGTCFSLTRRLLSCLVGPDDADVRARRLAQYVGDYLSSPQSQAAAAALLAVITQPAADTSVLACEAARLTECSGEHFVDICLSTLLLVLDYTHGCFAIAGMTRSDLLHQVAAIPTVG